MLKIGIIFTILFVIFIPQFHTQSYDNAKINCFIRHLKAKKILRDDFQETPTIRDITHCDKVVDSAKNVYLKKIEQSAVLDLGSLNLENMLESERRCFDDDIKTREIGDYMLKLIVYRSLGVVSVNLVVDQEKTRDHILDLIAMSASYCTFNTLYDTFNNERIKNYCKRRYVLDNNILGLKEYNLTLNPFNVHIPKIDYEQRIQKIVADESKFIENKINSERSDDEPRFKFKDDEALTFLSRNWATIFLTELNISPEEKDEKKKQYSKDLFAFHKSKNIIPIEDECCDYLRYIFSIQSVRLNIMILMLLLLAIIITAESIETFDNSDINCFIRHLKSLNKLESNYPEYRTRNEIQDCQIGVKKFKIDTYKKITNNDCIQKRLRGENWADYKMKAIVLDLSQHNDEYQRLDELKNVINVKLKEATRYCRLEEEYGELFDVFYNLHEHMDENDKKLVACFEKYSIEYGLIFNYTITSDSHSMNFNCTEIIDEFMITMEENLVENLKQENSQVTQAEIECSLKIYRTEKFIQKIIITVIRGKMSLNETQKLNEKRNFIEFFILITQKVQGCLL